MNKKEFLMTIKPGMVVNEEFFLRVYGYSLYDPEFLNQVANILLKQRNIFAMKSYNKWLSDYKKAEKEEMKIAASWLRKRNEDRRNALLKRHAYNNRKEEK